MLMDSPMPGVNTVKGMIGISAAPVGRDVLGQPQEAMQQRPEGVGADSGQRGVNGGDGGIDDLASGLRRGCRRLRRRYVPASVRPCAPNRRFCRGRCAGCPGSWMGVACH